MEKTLVKECGAVEGVGDPNAGVLFVLVTECGVNVLLQVQITLSPGAMLVTAGLKASPLLPTATLATAAKLEMGWLEMTQAAPKSATFNKCHIAFILYLDSFGSFVAGPMAAERWGLRQRRPHVFECKCCSHPLERRGGEHLFPSIYCGNN